MKPFLRILRRFTSQNDKSCDSEEILGGSSIRMKLVYLQSLTFNLLPFFYRHPAQTIFPGRIALAERLPLGSEIGLVFA